MSLIAGAEDDESPHYVSECLRILITALEDPMGHFDENLLAAIILLRTHEELSGETQDLRASIDNSDRETRQR